MAPIALSLGDPSGVGPELIAAVWSRRAELGLQPFFVVGGASVLEHAARQCGLDIETVQIQNPADAATYFGTKLPVYGTEDCTYTPGKPSQVGARLALASLTNAAELAIQGSVSAIATAPVAKSLLAEVGFTYPGQTEFLADICGLEPDDAVMMLAGPQLRAVPLTVHCPLSEVAGRISSDLIRHRAAIMAKSLQRDFGIAAPRIAVAGLNPHAGEDGKFGPEEQEIIAPAIAQLQADGIKASGPHPADALFAPHARGGYDAALCMYHDQALIPVKALDFDQGVNVTLGLPIIRTSPDHGTAFDIAGKGIANPGAMIAAVKMAGECAARRATSNG